MRILLFCLLLFNLCSCKSEEPLKQRNFSEVEIETLLKDSLLNVRALEINEGRVVAATSNGKILSSILSYMSDFEEGNYWSFTDDSLMPSNFRSIAFQGDNTFTLSIGSPAKLFQDGRLVYYENNEKAFYDSMDFWNDQEGIAIGDPTDDCMSIIITRDGGETWYKLSCDDLPKAKEGEAAFAASDTNISIVGNHTWVATGGKASRILYSRDKGKTWEVFETPIIQGKATTGMYSLDFYDENNGFAIGGDYTKPNDTLNNKIRTIDGGKTWQVVANGKGPGYRSCVQYIPNSDAKELVAIGFRGIDYSNDSGDTWKHLSDEGFYTIRFLNDSIAYAAGKGRISKLTFRE
ncbi:oxidoreductase [Winogradskyella sp. J14-2]|uniref:WD40/YVTN/BNR-like repeat-containing protein n=1 Tax=Winogradskyella sp. J14-2 TaxID=1936080 RepID=UPI000972E3E9|nr:oxidoreductase [Winogradskyella sp. J14-2]APY09350.1 oxidoreductase [Winogradskyella sp. J14-2]